jgi:2-dehydro-3-deoxyphosphooctonate aldolase (KDO 8-P synthase)
MSTQQVDCASEVRIADIRVANNAPFVLFGGLNVLEEEDVVWEVVDAFSSACMRLGISWVFKASFDKANRTSHDSWRGPGMEHGLKLLESIKARCGAPLMTDIHEPEQAKPVAEVVDVLQIPAFLCRQTDLLVAAARTGAVINIKKAQFLAPADMLHPVKKCVAHDNRQILLCERGTTFGYHNLIVDMLGLDLLKHIGAPVLFDVTHALQLPGAGEAGMRASGRGSQILPLARSAMIQGIAGLFLETHPNPENARCDGLCALPLSKLDTFLDQMLQIDQLAKQLPAPTL